MVTATYQRAAELPRLYESLLLQTWKDFEWVLIDDGSSDGTGELARAWGTDAPFPIDYGWQPNQGKHAAVNRGVERARGEFCAVMDSDDWYAAEALESMIACWESIPVARRSEFANVEGLCADPDGNVIGGRFPADVFDSNTFEVEFLHGVEGDKAGMYRRDVLRAFPFPENLGWHVPPSLVWNRIAARWSSRFVNEIWGYKEYLAGGLTERGPELRLRSANARMIYWTEFAAMPRSMSRSVRLRANANSIRYSLWEHVPLRRVIGESASLGWTLAAVLFGLLLWLRDRLSTRMTGKGEDR